MGSIEAPAHVRGGLDAAGKFRERHDFRADCSPAVWAGPLRSNMTGSPATGLRRWGGKIILSLRQDQIFSNEGVHILPVKPMIYGPHQYLCSPQGSSPVKIKHTSISRAVRTTSRLARCLAPLCSPCWPLVAGLACALALAQQPQTIESDSGHRQPAHPQGDHPGAALYPPRRHLRPDLHRARLQLAVEHRRTSTTCASSARTRKRASSWTSLSGKSPPSARSTTRA